MSEPKLVPSRTLKSDFTKQTLRRSIAAKHRSERSQQIKGIFSMKQIIKQPIGALIAVAIVGLSSVGAYAAVNNWFKGGVSISSDSSIMHIDLTGCESSLPPGFDYNTDRKNVQFKITGSPHIEAEALKDKLLGRCEFDAVRKVFGGFTSLPDRGTIDAVDTANNSITLTFPWGPDGKIMKRLFTVSANASFYDKGQPVKLSDFQPGDVVEFQGDFKTNPEPGKPDALYVDDYSDPNNVVPIFEVVGIKGIFKTQYNTRAMNDINDEFYKQNNIMPFEKYNEISGQKK